MRLAGILLQPNDAERIAKGDIRRTHANYNRADGIERRHPMFAQLLALACRWGRHREAYREASKQARKCEKLVKTMELQLQRKRESKRERANGKADNAEET